MSRSTVTGLEMSRSTVTANVTEYRDRGAAGGRAEKGSEGPPGPRGEQQDAEDDRRRDSSAQAPPAVQEVPDPDEENQGARREERVRNWGHCAGGGVP